MCVPSESTHDMMSAWVQRTGAATCLADAAGRPPCAWIRALRLDLSHPAFLAHQWTSFLVGACGGQGSLAICNAMQRKFYKKTFTRCLASVDSEAKLSRHGGIAPQWTATQLAPWL